MTVFNEFNDLKLEMEKFSAQFEAEMAQKRTQIIAARQDFQIEINDLDAKEKDLQNQITQLIQKESKVKESIKKTLEDLQVQSLKVDELRLKHSHLLKKRDEIQESIDEVNQEIKIVSEKIYQSKIDLEDQNNRDYPELLKYEQYLGLRIEVVAVDLLQFIFSNVDPNDYKKEVWCQLGVGSYQYEIGETQPQISKETKDQIELELNEHKSFIKFLKLIRRTLRDS